MTGRSTWGNVPSESRRLVRACRTS